MYQVFQNNEPISKKYLLKKQAIIHCVEHGFVVDIPADFLSDGLGFYFVEGIEIREVGEDGE